MKYSLKALLASGLMLGMAGQSSACGNPLQWAMLFERHPEAKVAFMADMAARKTGLVQARPYLKRPGISYHSWSVKSLNRLAQEMAPTVAANLKDGGTLTVLLAIEVAAIRFYSDDRAPDILTAAELKTISDYNVTTTVNVLYSGWRHALNFDSMVENDLLIVSQLQAGDTLIGVFSGISKASFEPRN
ncbi:MULTISPECIES: hypothetical protein [unclassified Ruegeria]|uniref:hypothetical protein n=1 Tax=unclassified Ruegeria TaxID=2625375 RepID=UPI0014898D4C|nr:MULTISPECIES: hypothetical protein [unclassified Ruegeria]